MTSETKGIVIFSLLSFLDHSEGNQLRCQEDIKAVHVAKVKMFLPTFV